MKIPILFAACVLTMLGSIDTGLASQAKLTGPVQ